MARRTTRKQETQEDEKSRIWRLAGQFKNAARELAYLGAMCCSNDAENELGRRALQWMREAIWMKTKAEELEREYFAYKSNH